MFFLHHPLSPSFINIILSPYWHKRVIATIDRSRVINNVYVSIYVILDPILLSLARER